MFCARCGQQIPEAWVTCPLCGRETTIQLPPQQHGHAQGAVAAVLAPEDIAAPATKPIRRDLQGVGGWLLVFCIATAVLNPAAIFNVLLTAQATNTLFDSVTWSVIAFAAFGLVTGLTAFTGSAKAIPMLQLYFTVLGGFAVLNMLGLLVEKGEVTKIVALLRQLIFVVLWAMYFHKSERVRATFGRNL